MPLRVISSAEAVENVRHNLFGKFPSRDNPAATEIAPNRFIDPNIGGCNAITLENMAVGERQ